MIKVVRGNFLEASAEALVNTVNCVGVMGKGIALQSKKAFPDNYDAYLKACRKGEIRPGHMFVYETGRILNPRYIVNFPTKRHWKGRSRYEDIEAGLRALVAEVRNRKIGSIAIPSLGCGLGGLNWKRVRSMIEDALSGLPEVEVHLYEPAGTPSTKEMPIGTREPRMTVARALFIKLMQLYDRNAYRLTLLEIQKLAYFLQESGQNLRLHYVKHTYGPYAHNLNKVLEVLEGHYIRGYGDTQKPDVEIELLPEAPGKADMFLTEHPEAARRLERVSALVDGFETPYGMELLSSVHWVAVHDMTAVDVDGAVGLIRSWNERKERLFRPEHVRIAWDRLVTEEWIRSMGSRVPVGNDS
ncbi:MAG: macro domain-containing protein [Chloroflexota bacterium]